MIVELLDQMVRTESGGEIGRRLTSGTLSNSRFVVERLGIEAEQLLTPAGSGERPRSARPGLAHYLRRVREEVAVGLAGLVLGRNGRAALREGLFQHSGELHLWMYDRLSLERVLRTAGFSEIARQSATDSRIPNFASYDLDTIDGRVRKPDSLFMEAVRL